MNEETTLILQGLSYLIINSNPKDENMKEIQKKLSREIMNKLNPKEEQSLPSKTADALRGK